MEIWRLDMQKNVIIGMAAKKYKEERLSDSFIDKDIITIYNESQLYDNVEAAIELPTDLVQDAMTGMYLQLREGHQSIFTIYSSVNNIFYNLGREINSHLFMI